jgi:hypothetical protein
LFSGYKVYNFCFNILISKTKFQDLDEHLDLMEGMLVDLLHAKWNTFVKFRLIFATSIDKNDKIKFQVLPSVRVFLRLLFDLDGLLYAAAGAATCGPKSPDAHSTRGAQLH